MSVEKFKLPTPTEVGFDNKAIPNKAKYDAGFEHALKGAPLRDFQYSFRMGFRAGKLFLKEERKRRGIIDFPQKLKFNIKSKFRD